MAERPVTGGREEPAAELTLTSTGGGRMKWLVAAVALVVLAGAVYIGISGQSSALPQSSSQPAAQLAPSTTAPTATPYPDNQVISLRVDPTAPVVYQYLGTGLTLNGHGTLAILDPIGPDEYMGIYRVPYSQLGPVANLELDAVTASVSHDDLDRLGDWAFPLNIGRADDVPMTVFSTVGGMTDQSLITPQFQRLATDGYQLGVTVAAKEDAALMTIDVVVQPHLRAPNEMYTVLAGPTGDQFSVPLEQYTPGGFDGQALVPTSLYGTDLPVSLAAASLSDGSAISVGTWPIKVPPRPHNNNLVQIHATAPGDPAADKPGILANGYWFEIGEKLVGGDLYLVVNLSVTVTIAPETPPGPVPTR
ncbi:MAG TPA: hypothetical protein VH371_02585 [Candidatus Limnocylindrales bacterium]